MSSLTSLLRPLPAARRAYSVFSKPGGGRYFNAAKPPTQTGKLDASVNNNGENSATQGVVEEATPSSSGSSTNVEAKSTSTLASSLNVNFNPLPVHPTISPMDLKLHQFFSMHRPLLTVSQPGSSIFESLPQPFSFPPVAQAETSQFSTIDNPPEASPESDADAARQLARAMVANRVGSQLSWESTLQRLGLDMTEGRAEEVKAAKAEFDVYMDSVQRKRRKKMKKHKLKKRRRLSRAQRMKIGR